MKLTDLRARLDDLASFSRLREPDDGLLRVELAARHGAAFIDAARNDYLGLTEAPANVSRETSGADHARGAGASRLIFGSAPEHLQVEREVATWLGFPAALLFASGYAANVGALSALLSEEDAVFSDQLNHASLIDGMRLARVRPRVFPHLDLDELERGLRDAAAVPARWVIVEAYYSMDGDGPDLARLRQLCNQYDAALYVDEAHSVGTFGPAGAGLCVQKGVRADVLMAAFGKAVGSHGACILGSAELRTWLWNRARSFVFSTAPSPVHVAFLQEQIARTRAAHGSRDRLGVVVEKVRRGLAERGVSLPKGSFGPIVSLHCGSEGDALGLAGRLREAGILAQAIRPPTVPARESRVRLVLGAALDDLQTTNFIEIVARETLAPEKSCIEDA